MKTVSKLALIVATLSLLASGCSSNPDKEMAKRLAALEKAERDRIAEQKAFEQAQRKEEINLAPRWFLSPPEPDGTGFYGVGYAKSKQMGHALKAARLQAEFELAKMYRQELSGSERSFERGNTDGDVVTQTTFLIDKIVDAVPVIGYTIVEQKMVPLNGTFETFVLLKLPYDEFNKVLKSQREKELDKTVQASFDDLERRLNNRRQQREQEEQARFQREQEALRNRADILQQGAESIQPQTETQPVGDQAFKTIPTPAGLIRSVVGG